MAGILDNDFKITVSKMLKELKGDVEKVKRTLCEQNKTIHKKIENLKKNKPKILEL